jgi:polyisoprenoid-binding protein YceI
MKRIVFLILIAAAVFYSCKNKREAQKAKIEDAREAAELSGSVYLLAEGENYVQWIGTKPGGQHHGTVNITNGVISVKNKEITAGNFSIDMNSIVNLDLADSGMNRKLVNHLKSQDFFYVEKYPQASFQFVGSEPFTGVSPLTEGGIKSNYEITGNLTMRGVTRSITFPCWIELENGSVMIKTNPFSINRTFWDVNYMSKSIIAELKDKFIADEIMLQFDLKFILKGDR